MPRKECKRNKVDICEDCCFICKDGGLLMVCDYRDCLKAYHPDCVGKDDSFVETGERWTCNWHSCSFCHKSAKFQCLCCTQAVCRCCISNVDFPCVRGNKGFCNHCLKLALLIDEGKGVDSDGVKVDFNERDTYEFFFKEYLEIIKVKEGLTWENVRSAANSLKKGKSSKCEFDSNEISKMEENTRESEEESHLVLSDYDDSKDTEEYEPVGDKKVSKKKPIMRKRKVKSKKTEFIGWGSKTLLEFLSSIGRDTSKELSQYEVTTIVTDYCKENKLFHPERKKRVLCDARLQSLLGRKSLSKNSIYNFLNNHFAENFEQSEEDEFSSCCEHNEDLLGVCKRQRKLSTRSEPQKSKVTEDLRKSCYASITVENIKLVYLKRSLVEELLKQPTFDAKVVGSFVRVKSDPNDYLQRNSHQLMQVIGVNTLRNSEMNDEILLELSSFPKNVPICKLSDDYFSEEECGDLRERIKAGILKKLTVVELEQKARSLHEDITKHWIERELTLLQKHIDRANEKGWRRELSVYIEKRLLLQSRSEQSRLLNELPEVIADIEEPEPAFEDSSRKVKQGPDSFLESPIGWVSQTPSSNLGSETFSCPNSKTDAAEMKNDCNVSLNGVENQSIGFVAIELPQRSRIHAYEVQGDIFRRKLYESASEKKKSCSKSLLTEELQPKPLPFAYESPPNVTHQQQHQYSCDIGGKVQNQPTDIHGGEVKNKCSKTVELTGPSGDDQERKVAYENPTCAVWNIIDPHDGEIMGPYTMSMLKQWNGIISCELKYKVCKTGQRQEDAIFLTDAIDQFDSDIGGKGQDQATGIKKEEVKSKSSKMIELIELSDDDDEDCKVANESPTWAGWLIIGPRGEIMGPYSLSVLKQWSDSSPQELKSKVWKTGQSQKEAIFLSDAISQVFGNS